MTNWRAIVAIESGVILFFGVLTGIVVSQAKSVIDRDVIVNRYREALRQRNRGLMDIEVSQMIGPVAARLERVDDAVAASRFDEAQTAWNDAYGAAVRSRREEA